MSSNPSGSRNPKYPSEIVRNHPADYRKGIPAKTQDLPPAHAPQKQPPGYSRTHPSPYAPSYAPERAPASEGSRGAGTSTTDCNRCEVGRVNCDRALPVCMNCLYRGSPCTYDAIPNSDRLEPASVPTAAGVSDKPRGASLVRERPRGLAGESELFTPATALRPGDERARGAPFPDSPHTEFPMYTQQSVQNSPTAYYRPGIPTKTQDAPSTRASQKQSSGYPQTHPPPYAPSYAPERARASEGGRGTGTPTTDCNHCEVRGIKCDRTFPECASCLRRRWPCTYATVQNSDQPEPTSILTAAGASDKPQGASPVRVRPQGFAKEAEAFTLATTLGSGDERAREFSLPGSRHTNFPKYTQQTVQVSPTTDYRRGIPTMVQEKRASVVTLPASQPTNVPKHSPEIVQNPPAAYRKGIPTTSQDASWAQASQNQPSGYPQTNTSYYAPSYAPASQHERGGGGGADLGPTRTLTQELEQLSITTQPAKSSQNVNVVLFGAPGVGKSSVVNLIARKNIARVLSGTHDGPGFPLQSTRYDISVDSMNVSIFETTGLDESEIRPDEYLVVLEKAHGFVHKICAGGGIHLLLFCMRADRLSATTECNYRLFSEVVFPEKVPVALVVTGLERERDMEAWWTRHVARIERYGIKTEAHACITTVLSTGQEYKYAESEGRIRELLKRCCLSISPPLPAPMDWFFRLWNGMQQFADKRRRPPQVDIQNTLTMRLKLDARTARAFLENMDRPGGDALVYTSGRGGEDLRRDMPAGPSTVGVRVNNQVWAGEDDPRSATSSRSRRSDAGGWGHEPHRSASMENAQYLTTLDPGGRPGDNQQPRRAMNEVPITPGPSHSRHSKAEEDDRVCGRWEDSTQRRVEPRKANNPLETTPETGMYPSRPLAPRAMVSKEDIRSNFPSDLTGHVTRSSRHPFASGSFGDIYIGTLTWKGELVKVAIKVYKVYLQRNQYMADRLKRFRREITVWQRLDHQNVLLLYGTIRDSTVDPEIPAMVCPWVENGALSAYLDQNKDLQVTQRLILLNDVARGLRYLHAEGVIHGDLSGSNVLVGADGRARIADFGLSMLLETVAGPSVISSRRTEGTVRWMAPELLDPHNPRPLGPTIQSDVYSFGSIMFQILTGNIPYHHLSRDAQVIYALSQGMKPDRPTRGAVTSNRWGFIERCWSSGGRRPSSDEIVDYTKRELAESRAGRN